VRLTSTSVIRPICGAPASSRICAFAARRTRTQISRSGPTASTHSLSDGVNCYVFLRHDADGTSALRAVTLAERLSQA